MSRRTWITALLCLLPLAFAPAVAGAGAAEELPELSVTKVFSPNDDGVKDTAKVRFTLPRRDKVRVVIRERFSGELVHKVGLGRLPAGDHVWRWDGSTRDDVVLQDGDHTVTLVTTRWPKLTRVTSVDRRFSAWIGPRTLFGAPSSERPRLYPRTRVVRDSFDLGVGTEPLVRSARLVIFDRDGDRVFRRLMDETQMTVAWTARRDGRPLPVGTYRALVRGEDRAGNTGHSRAYYLRVTDKRLVWREESFPVSPAATRQGDCWLSTANGCGDFPPYGTVVPSEIYPPDGLSYRSAEGDSEYLSIAWAQHYLPVPATTGVRGVDRARVGFAGTPTNAGEDDSGELRVVAAYGWPDGVVSSSSGATTDWVTHLDLGEGLSEEDIFGLLDPGVHWTFATYGTDWFDVESFTVDVRYLAVR